MTDLVPVLEAIGDGLGNGVDPDGDTLEHVPFDSGGEGGTREPDEPHRQVPGLWATGFRVDGGPNPERTLRPDIVEAQRGEEADHAVRDALGHLHERVVLGDIDIRKAVQPARDPDQGAIAHHPIQRGARNPSCGDIPRANDADSAGQPK